MPRMRFPSGVRHRNLRSLDRRCFLLGTASLVGLPLLGLHSGCSREPKFSANPFTLGVASGDPSPDGVVLWTRLATEPLTGGGLPPDEAYDVHWRVASDANMLQVVQSGTATASPELAHSVHVEVNGLEPGRWYWYEFRAGSEVSSRGRSRTAVATAQGVDRLKFSFVSCQHYEHGYFSAFRHMAADDLDLVIHLGDYIYEAAGLPKRVRKHLGGELKTLEDYRNRYAQYRSDPDLQAAHQAFPWIVTWDDHEFDNNYAADVPEEKGPMPRDKFLARRAAAYQAYYEHMPLRRSSIPNGPNMQLYRRFVFGNLAQFDVLDTRQYRSDQPCGDGNKPRCDGVFAPNATIMGTQQEKWLFDGLDQSRALWNVIAQQVMVAPLDRVPGGDKILNMDKWGAYDTCLNRFMHFLDEGNPSNPLVLTGDIHNNWVNDLHLDFADPRSKIVGTELVGTSIASGGDGSDWREDTEGVLRDNPFIRFFNDQRGYVRCLLSRTECRADYQVLDFVERPGGSISTRASFVVQDGVKGVKKA